MPQGLPHPSVTACPQVTSEVAAHESAFSALPVVPQRFPQVSVTACPQGTLAAPHCC